MTPDQEPQITTNDILDAAQAALGGTPVAEEQRPSVAEEPRATETPLGELAAMKLRLAERDQNVADMEAQLRRMAADFDNFRRRQNIERENLVKFAGERILERFLDVLDNFERALQAGEKATDPKQVLTGVSLIYRQLQDFLSKEGVAVMDAKGSPFDPNQHEAVVKMDVDDVPDETVLEEFRKGYLLNGRVMRHAMVKVANNPSIPAIQPLPPEIPATGTPSQDSDEPANTDSVQEQE